MTPQEPNPLTRREFARHTAGSIALGSLGLGATLAQAQPAKTGPASGGRIKQASCRAAFGKVSIHLPTASARAESGNPTRFLTECAEAMDLALRALRERLGFLKDVGATPGTPLETASTVVHSGPSAASNTTPLPLKSRCSV